MVTGNAVNANQTGIQTFTGTAFTGSAVTQHGVLVGGASNAVVSTSVGSTGQVLQANTGADPTYSTATYPSTATATGTILRANGTNWVATTATYPTTTTAFQLLASTSASVVGEITAGASSTVLVGNSGAVPSFSATPTVTSITFGSGTALSIFQQGTFSPTVRGSSTAGTVAMGTQLGRYQKVGRIVTVSIVATWTTIGTATGAVQINNLPFSLINDSNACTAPSLVTGGGGVALSMGGTTGAVPFLQGNANTTTANINYFSGVSSGGNFATTIAASNGFACQYTYETV